MLLFSLSASVKQRRLDLEERTLQEDARPPGVL